MAYIKQKKRNRSPPAPPAHAPRATGIARRRCSGSLSVPEGLKPRMDGPFRRFGRSASQRGPGARGSKAHSLVGW